MPIFVPSTPSHLLGSAVRVARFAWPGFRLTEKVAEKVAEKGFENSSYPTLSLAPGGV